MSDALVAQRLSKRFPGQLALDGVDFTVVPGEVHGLLGQNGSGKSTLIKILAGYHVPESGARVSVRGQDLHFGSPAESRRAGLRFVHQHLGILDNLNVVENVALASGYARRRSRLIDWDRQARKTERLLAKLGVEIDIWKPVADCRAVERSAIAIARALDDEEGRIHFLVLDEPTAALPPVEVDRLFEVVEEIRAQGIGVVHVTHRLDEISRLADRVTVLRDGRLQGTFDVTTLDRRGLIEIIVGHAVDPSPQNPVGPDRPHARVPVSTPEVLAAVGLSSRTLGGVTFRVGAGEVLGVAGLVGSGRDEILYALGGAVPSRATSLRVGGREISGRLTPSAAKAAGIALAPGGRQRGTAVSRFSMRENMTLPTLERYVRGPLVSKRREAQDVSTWIERLDVQPPRPEQMFAELSGGNQQKVVLAKWLNTAPAVVLLDEPTAGVDVGAREAIYELIRAHAATGISFVVASSDLEDLVALCSRVLVLRDGVISCELHGDEVAEQELLHALMGESKDGPAS
jgi:ribose transport system ATP-binding protein